jgi:hypothetical protein
MRAVGRREIFRVLLSFEFSSVTELSDRMFAKESFQSMPHTPRLVCNKLCFWFGDAACACGRARQSLVRNCGATSCLQVFLKSCNNLCRTSVMVFAPQMLRGKNSKESCLQSQPAPNNACTRTVGITPPKSVDSGFGVLRFATESKPAHRP